MIATLWDVVFSADQLDLRNNLAGRDEKLQKLRSKLDALMSGEKSDDSRHGNRAELSDELQRCKHLCDDKSMFSEKFQSAVAYH